MRTLVLTLFLLASAAVAAPDAQTVTPQGMRLAAQLDALGVESKWLARQHVDWRTGLPDRDGQVFEHGHTHCSAFVAAAAMSLGVHILRPPEHSAKLLRQRAGRLARRRRGPPRAGAGGGQCGRTRGRLICRTGPHVRPHRSSSRRQRAGTGGRRAARHSGGDAQQRRDRERVLRAILRHGATISVFRPRALMGTVPAAVRSYGVV